MKPPPACRVRWCRLALGTATLLALFAWLAPAQAQQRAIPLGESRSGLTYTGADVRAMQADDFSNPAMLWAERGEKLWSTPAANGLSCASCHNDARASMKGVAARYPVFEPAAKRLFNVEARINACRVDDQKAEALKPESEDLLVRPQCQVPRHRSSKGGVGSRHAS